MKTKEHFNLAARVAAALFILAGTAIAELPEPMAYWSFDEGQGPTVYDSVGDKDGTVHGAEWALGQIGSGLRFDGVDDYVSLPDNEPIWLPQNDFTVSAWVYFEREPGSAHEVIIDLNCGQSAHAGNELGYMIQVTPADGGRLFFGITTTTNSDEDLVGQTVLVENTWYHIAAVRDGTTQAIYVDGQLDDSRTCSPDPIDFVGGYDDNKVNIGRFSSGGGPPPCYFQGMVDEVKIFDTALSGEEIQQLYKEGSDAYTKAVMAIRKAMEQKEKTIEMLDAALAKEQAAIEAINVFLSGGELGDLTRRDVFNANVNVRIATIIERLSRARLIESISRLESALDALGYEPGLQQQPDAKSDR